MQLPRFLLVLCLLPVTQGVLAGPARSPSRPPELSTIASLLADRNHDTLPDARGRVARIRAVVTVPSGALRRRSLQVMVQDETGGIGLYNREPVVELAVGDLVEAVGTVSQYKGAVQLQDVRITRLGRIPVPDALPVSLAEAASWRHMGRLVRVEGEADELSVDGFARLRLTGEDGRSIWLFIPAPVADRFDWKRYPRGTRVAATGVLSIFKPNWPYDDGFQVIVIRPQDLVALSAPVPAWQRWAPWAALGASVLLCLGLLLFHLLGKRQKARDRELKTLAALSREFGGAELDETQLARRACDILIAYGVVDAALVHVFDGKGGLRQLAASAADPGVGAALHFDEPFSGMPQADEMHHRQWQARAAERGLALLAIQPLVAAEGTLGFLVALSPRRRRSTALQERTLLSAAKLLAMALDTRRVRDRARDEQREMQQLVITDELTRLCNRRFLDEYLRVQIPLAQRRGGGLAFLAIDIDHFKQINDRYGHEVGDRVLAEVAAQLRTACRNSDLPVRLGGEEFLVVASEQEPGGALALAERIRTAIGTQHHAIPGGTPVHVTVSIGVAMFGPDGDTAAALLRASDEAMYASKRAGRNRVTLADASAAAMASSDAAGGDETDTRGSV